MEFVYSCVGHKPMVSPDTYCFKWDEHHHWSRVWLMEPSTKEINRYEDLLVPKRDPDTLGQKKKTWKLHNVTRYHCNVVMKVWYVILSMSCYVVIVFLIYFTFKWNGKTIKCMYRW